MPLGSQQRLLGTKFRLGEILEAGGVEPPSEERYGPKTTCLAHSVFFASGAQSEQETQPASPMGLAAAFRTETLRPACCVTP